LFSLRILHEHRSLSAKQNALNWLKQNNYSEKEQQQTETVFNMNRPFINYDQVLVLSNHNTELTKKLLEAFLYELAPVINTFCPNPSDEDMEAVSKLTHKIKPSLQLLELETINQKMNIYKMKYREGTSAARKELPGLYNEILEFYKQIQEEILNYIANMDE
jgi:hypothetical protein